MVKVRKRPQVGDSLVEMTKVERRDWPKLKNLPDSKLFSDQRCPRCDYETYLGQFHYYHNPSFNLLIAICPNCDSRIQYDALLNRFLREGEKSKAKTRYRILWIALWTAISVGLVSMFCMFEFPQYKKTFLTLLIICILAVVLTTWVAKRGEEAE